MQMILLAFAVIAICAAAHLKCYNGSTFKLQGWRRRKTLTMV